MRVRASLAAAQPPAPVVADLLGLALDNVAALAAAAQQAQMVAAQFEKQVGGCASAALERAAGSPTLLPPPQVRCLTTTPGLRAHLLRTPAGGAQPAAGGRTCGAAGGAAEGGASQDGGAAQQARGAALRCAALAAGCLEGRGAVGAAGQNRGGHVLPSVQGRRGGVPKSVGGHTRRREPASPCTLCHCAAARSGGCGSWSRSWRTRGCGAWAWAWAWARVASGGMRQPRCWPVQAACTCGSGPSTSGAALQHAARPALACCAHPSRRLPPARTRSRAWRATEWQWMWTKAGRRQGRKAARCSRGARTMWWTATMRRRAATARASRRRALCETTLTDAACLGVTMNSRGRLHCAGGCLAHRRASEHARRCWCRQRCAGSAACLCFISLLMNMPSTRGDKEVDTHGRRAALARLGCCCLQRTVRVRCLPLSAGPPSQPCLQPLPAPSAQASRTQHRNRGTCWNSTWRKPASSWQY